jgi:hypothetical protein
MRIGGPVKRQFNEQRPSPDVPDVDRLSVMPQPYAASEIKTDPASEKLNNAWHEGPERLAAKLSLEEL